MLAANVFASRVAPRVASRIASRRTFSFYASTRNVARSVEPHPFERLSSQKPAPADWGVAFGKAGRQAAVYFPVGFALLGWPLVARELIDGHV